MSIFRLIPLLSISAILLFAGCHQQVATYDSYFYSTDNPESGQKYFLSIDNSAPIELPYFSIKPAFSNDTLLAKAVNMNLAEGKHQIEVKDNLGIVVNSATLTTHSNFLYNGVSVSGGKGGIEVSESKYKMLVNLTR